MDNSTEKKLIELSLLNDEKAFRKLVEAFQHMVYTLSFRILCNEEEAKDAVQETFVKCWMQLSHYNPEKKFSTWLFTIATNVCLDYLKSSRMKVIVDTMDTTISGLIASDDVEKELINSELAAVILMLTNDLTPKQKIVFSLRYFEELEIEQIIEITGLTSEKIKSNLYLARKIIRKKLEKY